ncbi:MAG: pyridoxamine 5'-phosphate oxidase family protein [Gammaproteobacteria bacterium]|nr:pyridoxamine 5'-phosphate oxidase family protein [Gammaproteobacteria bacterium]MDH5651904.1 pyridoxamine 5'-phosphate oxidase family protein [Gammaproteobacteria bacterium]
MKVYPGIPPEIAAWIADQKIFFLASAPLSPQGHVNLSPRGLDSIRVVDPNQVVILDLTGSGNETAAHLLENGRITVMMCAFEGKPMILRLFGEGEVILPGDDEWADFRPLFDADIPGVRQIFRILVTRVQTSCGEAVPLMDFVAHRDELTNWAHEKGAAGIAQYQKEKNAVSIDGLPGPEYDREPA